MNQSPTIGALAAALAKAQGRIKGAIKDSTNPFFKSHYADLSSVKDACQQALTEFSIAVIQSPSADGAKVSLTTLLCHDSSEWVSGTITATAKDESAQSVGSVITYLRRYALASMVGVTAEDDDGESAQPRHPTAPTSRHPLTPQIAKAQQTVDAIVAHKNIEAAKAMLGDGPKSLDDRRKALWTRLKDLGMPAGAAADWVKTNRVSHSGTDMTVADFDKMEGLVAAIEKKEAVKDDVQF